MCTENTYLPNCVTLLDCFQKILGEEDLSEEEISKCWLHLDKYLSGRNYRVQHQGRQVDLRTDYGNLVTECYELAVGEKHTELLEKSEGEATPEMKSALVEAFIKTQEGYRGQER